MKRPLLKGFRIDLKSATFIVCTLLLFSAKSGFASEIYQWIDEEGVVHFSNETPPENARILKQWKETTSAVPSDIQPNKTQNEIQGETTGPAGTSSGMDKSPDKEKPEKDSKDKVESDAMQRLKRNLKIRTSTDKQRKLKRRIDALESTKEDASKPVEKKPSAE
ncbi:MAG: DUF4124 domain-containing protein [Thermodesulfobacteriota bacterium]